MAADEQGRPVRFILTGGQEGDAPQALPLLRELEFSRVIAGRAYDSNQILAFIRERGAGCVIPPVSNRRRPHKYDRELYKLRNLIERAFNRLKNWRRIATRYDRRSLYYLSALHLAAAITWAS